MLGLEGCCSSWRGWDGGWVGSLWVVVLRYGGLGVVRLLMY